MFQYFVGFAALYVLLNKMSSLSDQYSKVRPHGAGGRGPPVFREYVRDDYAKTATLFNADPTQFSQGIMNAYPADDPHHDGPLGNDDSIYLARTQMGGFYGRQVAQPSLLERPFPDY